MSDQPVITVDKTPMIGTVVRWYRSVDDAAQQQACLLASWEGVAVHTERITDVPDDWIDAAKRAYGELREDRDADMSGWATHQRRNVLGARSGPLEPVKKEEG